MSDAVVKLDALEDHIALVTIDNPPVNAHSTQVLAELASTFDAISDRAELRVAVLTGAGKVFCAGADIAELLANKDVEAIDSPIGWLPHYDDLKKLFETIDKEYPKSLYDMQFSLYIDNILDRIEMQSEAYRKEDGIPPKLFTIYEKQTGELRALKDKFGPVVSIDKLG